MRVLDLFSGIGGFALGLERAGMTTVSFCEIDPFCRAVLAKHWPGVPCHDDITTREFAEGEADVVCGGFPCQDISNAGKRAGITGSRSGLWRELVRAVRVVRPKYAIVENVAALLNRGMGVVLGDLAESGYDAEWDCIPACAVGAPHIRDRAWIVSYPAKIRCSKMQDESLRNGQLESSRKRRMLKLVGISRWDPEPGVRRVVDGISNQLDKRLGALGNAVVPQVVELIGRAIMEADSKLAEAKDDAGE